MQEKLEKCIFYFDRIFDQFAPFVDNLLCMKNRGHFLNGFDIKVIVKSDAIIFSQILGIVLDLPAK